MAAGRRPVPSEPVAWLREIASSYRDARETIPFGELIGHTIDEDALFHLAPSICLKMRGLPLSGAPMRKARDAALASHFGLDLLDNDEVGEIMEFVEQHRDDLARLIDPAT